jgi:hypothetical protein
VILALICCRIDDIAESTELFLTDTSAPFTVQAYSLAPDGTTGSSDMPTAQLAVIIRGMDSKFNVTEENGCPTNLDRDNNRDRFDGRIRQS